MSDTIDNLVISIETSSTNAQGIMDDLAASMRKVGRVSKSVSKSMQQVVQSAKDMAGATRPVTEGMDAFASASRDAEKASRDTAKAAEAASNAMKPVESSTEDVASTTEAAGRSIDGFGNSIQSSVSLLSSFGLVLKNIGGTDKAAFSAISAIPKALGGRFIGNIKSAISGLTGFLGAIKRVATYRLIRTVLKEITQGFAEGQKALYAWSNANGDQFAKSMDRLATSAQYFRNSLAAMAAPIYNALAPAIEYIVDKFVAMFNTVNQLFARLAGQTTYTAAKKVAAKWDDASKSASKTEKALKRTILGFDEINRLSGNTDNGGGAKSQSDNGAGMFETRKIDSPISSLADQLKNAFSAGDWKQLGKIIGNKINDVINGVDWSGIGRKVGEWINGWFTTKYWTLDTINFNNIGGRIAEFLNNALSRIDFGTIGRTLVQKLTIMWDMVLGFFTNLDWGLVASKISEFVKGIYDELTKWFGSYDWGNIGTVLYNKLKDALTNFDFAGVASSFMTMLGSAVRALVSAGVGFIGAFWRDISDYWNKNIKGATFTETVHNLLAAIGQGLGELPVWVYKNIVKPFTDALFGEGGLEKAWQALKVSASEAWGTIKETISNAWETVKSTTLTIWNALKDFVSGNWEELKRSATEKWEIIKNTISTVWNNLKVWATDKWESIKKTITDVWDNLKSGASEKWAYIKSTLSETWNSIKTNSQNAFNSVKDSVSSAWTSAKNGLNDFVTWIGGALSSKWNNAWTKIVEGFGRIFSGIKNKMKEPLNAVIGFINTMIDKIENAINKIVNGINNALTIRTPEITLPFGAGTWGGWSWSPGLQGVSWGRIKTLAKGGILDDPTLFGIMGNSGLVGGEAGREAVLPLENNTEWMDALADRVTNRAAQNNMSFSPYINGAGAGGDGMELLAEYVRTGIESAISRVMDMMRDQTDYLRQINDKDFTAEVSTYAINNANRRTNRRAGTTIAPVAN